MSQKAQKQGNQFKIDEIKQNVQDKVRDTVDRARMSWILNLVLNQKTQQEIVKDIADGILDFKEIEDIFPWKFVQGLRQCTPEHAQNYLNRFKNMTDERMKGLLSEMISRKSREEILKLITDHSLNLDDIQKSYLRSYTEKNEEGESSTTPNVSTTSEEMLSKGIKNVNIKSAKEPKDTGTKKKRNTAKKIEKDTDTNKKKNNVEKAMKKVRVVKSKNEKCMINESSKVEGASKEILSTKENPLARMNVEKASNYLTESLMQTRNEGFEESLSKSSEGDQAAYELPVLCDTKKTANSKNLANDADGTKLASAKKASKKVRKDVKSGVRNKQNHQVDNFASLSRSNDYTKEKEKSKDNESDVENENAGTSYVMQNDCLRETSINDGFENSLQKSRTNQSTNITSITDTEEQDIVHSNKENEPNQIQEYNFNIQLNSSTPKKLNCETKTVRIKEEPKNECSLNEFDDPVDRYEEKDLNISKDVFKKVDSGEKLQTKKRMVRSNVKLSKKGTEPSKIAKAKTSGRTKKEATGRKAKDTERKESTKDRRAKNRSLDRKERRMKEKLRRNEKKMQKVMAQFSDQVVKLVKNMGYLKEDDESSSSYSSESSYSSSSESSYTSSSVSPYTSSSESCSCSECNCCDYSSSDDYSEYTLCSCSNCSSSCSSTDSNSDSDSDCDWEE